MQLTLLSKIIALSLAIAIPVTVTTAVYVHQHPHTPAKQTGKTAHSVTPTPRPSAASPTPSPTPSPSSTPKPTPTPAPKPSTAKTSTSSSSAPANHFIHACGLGLCLDGRSFIIHGATTYGTLDNPAAEIALAKQAHVNVLELVEYESQYHSLTSTTSEATWSRVDALIAAASQNGLHVILNFSSYGQSLQAAGQKPTTTDWQPFLSFVANRTNTKTGLKYAQDPTIAMVEMFGEIDAPNYNVPTRGTTSETTTFFQRTLAQWKTLDPNHLASTGGFSYINDPGSGIDWRTIVADPHNDICDVEVNSYPDRNISVPNLSSYCRGLGKPWFLAAWSSCYQTPWGADDINDWSSDDDMAAHAFDMYNLSKGAIGSDFWNLRTDTAHTGSCDLGPQFPKTFSTVQTNAP